MTIQEAIKWIRFDIDMMKFNPTTGEEAYLNDDAQSTIVALEKAIDALNDAEEMKKQNHLIDRQSVIKIRFLEFLFNVINPNEMEQYIHMYKSVGGPTNEND